MDQQHNSVVAYTKIMVGWIVWAIGAVNFTAVLTVVSTLLLIAYTTLQIYKLWRDIQKDRRIEDLTRQMANTQPATLGAE